MRVESAATRFMFSSPEAVARAFEDGFGGKRVLVAGDLMLDRYIVGEVTRISPEAPVPVVRALTVREVPGGAANVALNLAELGAKVSLLGYVGDDGEQHSLLRNLGAQGVDCASVLTVHGRPTVVKTRIMAGNQQMIRLDAEDSSPLAPTTTLAIQRTAFEQLQSGVDVVVLSDYAKGVLGFEVCQAIIGHARGLGIPVLVDPKGRDFTKYSGATALTPNRVELALATGVDPSDSAELIRSGERMRQRLRLEFLIFTRSEEGMTLLAQEGTEHFPAVAREVFDVSGAGDTVVATLAAAFAAELPVSDAVTLANLAAGLVVQKLGTTPVTLRDLGREAAIRSGGTPGPAALLAEQPVPAPTL